MITLLHYSIRGLYHEIRNIPKHYKRFNHDEKGIFRSLMFYCLYLILIIPSIFKFPELWWCVVLCLAILLIEIRFLLKQKELLEDMSKRFKYHVKQRLLSLYKKYYGIE